MFVEHFISDGYVSGVIMRNDFGLRGIIISSSNGNPVTIPIFNNTIEEIKERILRDKDNINFIHREIHKDMPLNDIYDLLSSEWT